VATGRIYYAEALFLEGSKDEAGRQLNEALRFYQGLKAPPSELPMNVYHKALAHAWLGRLSQPGKDQHSPLALDALKSAARYGFRQLGRLKRDRGFARLRESEEYRDDFEKVVAKVGADLARRPS
jgi:hypothetical protein